MTRLRVVLLYIHMHSIFHHPLSDCRAPRIMHRFATCRPPVGVVICLSVSLVVCLSDPAGDDLLCKVDL